MEAAKERIGTDRVHLNCKLAGFAVVGSFVRAQFVDRTGREAVKAEGRLLIACDGMHSAARRALFPDEGPRRRNGAVLWRGTAEFDRVLDGYTMIMAGHPRTKFVCYPISHSASRPGAQLINFIAERRFDTTSLADYGDWNRAGRLEDFLPAFENFRFNWLDVPALIRAEQAVWGLSDG